MADNQEQSFDTRAFGIDQLYAAGIFCAGLAMLPDHLAWGIIFSVLGAVWLGYLRLGRNPMILERRAPNILSVAVLCLAIAVMGYDVYDRHFLTPVIGGNTPTKLQIQYDATGQTVVPVTQINVFHYVSGTFLSRAEQRDPEGRLISTQTIINAVYLFIVFDKPIAAKTFRVDGNGALLPMYKIEDKSPRSALILFSGPVTNTMLSVEATF